MTALLMAYIISWGFLIASEYSQKLNNHRLIFKGLTSFIFLLSGIINMFLRQNDTHLLFSILMCVALFFCFLGDVFLSVEKNGADSVWFISGAALFMVAHGVFFLAFNTVLPFSPLDAVLIVVVTGAVFSISFLKGINVGGKKPLLLTYAFFLGLLMSKAVSFVVIIGTNDFTATVLQAAVLFTASDIILIIQLFREEKIKVLPFFNLLLYYTATMLLALSIGML